MKKHMIAAAVAATFSVPAIAQVTVSGTLDITPHATTKTFIGHDTATSAETRKTSRTDNGSGGWSTSVLNFTATEDLGGGLKATAFVNQVIDQSSGLLSARDRWVQLQTGAGTIKAGRFSPAIEGYGNYAVAGTTNTAGTTDSSGYDFIVGSLGYNNALSRSIRTSSVANNQADLVSEFDRTAADMGRQSGIVQYITPNFNGFTATAEYIKNSADRDGSGRTGKGEKSQQALRLDFTQGNLALSVATGKSKSTREAANVSSLLAGNSTTGVISGATDGTGFLLAGSAAVVGREAKSDVTWLGASYNFGVARVLFAHGEREDEQTVAGSNAAIASDLKVSNIGIQVPVGAITLTASYYDGKDSRTTSATDDVDLKGHQLSARYAFSKRTFAYIVTGENKTELKSGVGTASGNTKLEGTSIGVVHNF